MRKNKAVELLIVALLGVLIISIAVNPARAQVAASGFAVTDFATGFLSGNSGGCFPCGPLGLASDSSDNLFVMDPLTGFIYKFGPSGGVAGPSTQLNTAPIPSNGGLAFTKD